MVILHRRRDPPKITNSCKRVLNFFNVYRPVVRPILVFGMCVRTCISMSSLCCLKLVTNCRELNSNDLLITVLKPVQNVNEIWFILTILSVRTFYLLVIITVSIYVRGYNIIITIFQDIYFRYHCTATE